MTSSMDLWESQSTARGPAVKGQGSDLAVAVDVGSGIIRRPTQKARKCFLFQMRVRDVDQPPGRG